MPEESLFFGVFPPNKQLKKSVEEMNQALNQTSLIGNTFMYNLSCPDECDNNRFRDIYFLLAFDYSGVNISPKNQNPSPPDIFWNQNPSL